MKFFVHWGLVTASSIFVAGVALWLWTVITPGPTPYNAWASIFLMGILVVASGLMSLVNSVWPSFLGHAAWVGGTALSLIALFFDGDGKWLREAGFLVIAIAGLMVGAAVQSRAKEKEPSEKE